MTDLLVVPAETPAQLRRFVTVPWSIYRDDPKWVPPIITEQLKKLDPAHNSFWNKATRALWTAERGGRVVGSIAAIHDRTREAQGASAQGTFGFFECENDPATARALLDRASAWLRERGMTEMIGPYNPSTADDIGILVDGFDTRPALVEGHHPRYYGPLLEGLGMEKLRDAYAWLVEPPAGAKNVREFLPERLFRGSDRARANPDVRVREFDPSRWDSEVGLAHELFNTSLATVPEFVPIGEAEFRALAASFRMFIDKRMVLFLEVAGRPVAYALALPDINEAIQRVNGRLGPIGLAKLWWHSRHLHRASFKILVVHPEFRQRGLEALLIEKVAQALLDGGFKEADLSLTGEENMKINMILAGLGMHVYRTYRVYKRTL